MCREIKTNILFNIEEIKKLKLNEIYIFCDGSCSGNPGNGGCGTVLLYRESEHKYISKVVSEKREYTTNNRMELIGAINGLNLLKSNKYKINLVSDSKYLIDSLNKQWVHKWAKNNWRKSNKSITKNIDLWTEILNLINSKDINYIWVKGHNNNYFNEYCDSIARN